MPKKKTDKNQKVDAVQDVKINARIADLENKWKRAVADYLNLEKRVEKERQLLVRLASAQLLDKMLTVLDEIERVQSYLKDEGLALVIAKFRQVLASEGVAEIEAAGCNFDPMTMDAVELAEGDQDKVVEVVTKGYRLGDEVLRPAKVKVGKGREKEIK